MSGLAAVCDCGTPWTFLLTFEPPHDKTNKVSVRPAKTQISLGIRPVWSESSLSAQWVAKDPSFLHADSEDSDQTGWMPRLIWVFAGRITTLLVLSWGGSFLHAHCNNFVTRYDIKQIKPIYFVFIRAVDHVITILYNVIAKLSKIVVGTHISGSTEFLDTSDIIPENIASSSNIFPMLSRGHW